MTLSPKARAVVAAFVFAASIALPAVHADEVVRIMAANTTSGNFQNYDPGHGERIFQALDADIILIQEFNYGDDSPSDIRDFVDSAFGTEFSYSREGGNEQIPNGIVSRYPILQSGEWEDTQATNRDFAWARIDIPGDTHLWAVSVHFRTTDGGTRPAEANALVSYVQSQVPAGDYLVIGGDFNADAFSEQALTNLAAVVTTNGRPNDQNGNTGTNAGRNKPYDQILPSVALRSRETPVTIAGHGSSYSDGLVFDSRVFTPLSAVSPVQSGDSGTSGMQHMAVIRDFLIPTTATTEPSNYPTNIAGNATETTISLSWTDAVGSPIPDGYLIKASTNPAITAPTDGVNESADGDLSDGAAQLIIAAGVQSASFAGLPFDTSYHLQIFPFTDGGPIDYKTDGTPPTISVSTLPDSSNFPAAPVIEAIYYVHAGGFTAAWDKVPGATGYRVDVSERPTFTGGSGAVLIDENFDASSSVPSEWVDSGTANDTLASHYSSTSNCRALGSGDELESPPVDFPTQLSFYVDSSGGGSGNTGTVSYAVGGGAWQNLASFTVDTGGSVETFDLTNSPDLSTQSDVRFRFESSFFTWYLDDVLVNGSSGAAFVTGYEDLALGDVDRVAITGMDPNTTYYIRVRAENASGTSANSNTTTATTSTAGTPFETWSSGYGIVPADETADFDADLLSDFDEYAFDTDPTQTTPPGALLQLDRSGGTFEVSYRRSLAPGIIWNHFGSTDLVDFAIPMTEGLGFAQYQIVSVERFGSYEEVTLSVNTGAAPRFFFRIEATETL